MIVKNWGLKTMDKTIIFYILILAMIFGIFVTFGKGCKSSKQNNKNSSCGGDGVSSSHSDSSSCGGDGGSCGGGD